MAENSEVYWVSHRDAQGNLLCCPASLENEGEEARFKEWGTDFLFTDDLSAIQGTVADPESLSEVPEDLVESDEVNETAVVWSIKKKFKGDVIYTSIGTILIAMNPYRVISSLYTKEKLDIYKSEAMHSRGVENFESSPHIWGIARSSYVHLLKQGGKRQAIIISGESGAGKTEATKKIMTFLSYVSSSSGNTSTSSRHLTEKDEKEAIEHKVLMTNPLLESFGNAKTSRNDNSSRFGKWLEISFRVAGIGGAVKLSGAHIVHYLLEKSRVVGQAKGERNFHIFYQLFSHSELKLGAIEDYLYLNTSGCTMIKGVNDGTSGKDTEKSLDDLSVSRDNQKALYIALKGILCLGNIKMETGREGSDLVTCTPASKQAMKNAADSLGLNPEALENALATKKITAGSDTTEVHLTPAQAAEARNALAKEVYSRLFDYIIETANKSLEQHVNSSHSQQADNSAAGRSAFTTSVGLLDIFGFEIFALNSLEQLSINFANEKLQQYFLHYVLKREQEIYEAEGIDCERIIPPDNQDLIALFETPQTGVFARLNEEVKLPKGSDGSFLSKVTKDQAAARKKLEESEEGAGDAPVRFVKDVKMALVEFSINHFAGTVCYSAEGFVEKNKDRLFDHLDVLLQGSSNRYFARMMGSSAKDKSSSSGGSAPVKKLTIIQGFTAQLGELMQVLADSNPHFVRCIKPNETKSSAIFNEDLVLQQLRYSGVLEAIQIRKKGFPVRRAHKEFRWLYGPLSGALREDMRSRDLSERDKCELVVSILHEEAIEESSEDAAMFDSDIAIGKTMVFFRHNLLKHLEHRRHLLRTSKVPVMHRFGRMAGAVSRVRALKKGVAELKVLIDASMEHGGRNYQVHDDLKMATLHCESELKMLPIPVLRLAKERLLVLETVKEVMDEARSMCEPGAHARYADILAMHDAAKGLLDAAAELGFRGPDGPSDEVNSLSKLESSVAKKANFLRRFRDAIAAANEIDIRDCIVKVNELSQEEGGDAKIFSEEKEIAAKILVKIDADNARIQQAVDVCEALHKEEDKVFLDRSSSKLVAFQKGVTETLISFKTDPPAGEATSQFINLMRNYGAVLEAWKSRSWKECAQTARNVKQALGTLGGDGPGKLGSPVLVGALRNTVEPLGHALLHYIVPDIETNLSLPQLAAAVIDGPITAAPCLLSKILVGSHAFIRANSANEGLKYFHIDRTAVSHEALQSAVENVEAMELGSEDGLAMLPMLKALVNTRRFLREGQWMDVMRQTSAEAEMKQWEESYLALQARVRDAAGVSGPSLSLFADDELVPFVHPDDSRFKNDLFSIAKVAKEFQFARRFAKLQLHYDLMLAPLVERSATSTDSTTDVSGAALDAIIREPSLVEDSSSSLSAFADVLKILKDMREHYCADNGSAWAAVIELETRSDWNDLGYSDLEEADLDSRRDTPMFQCVTMVHDELVHIVRHSKSKVAERDLCAAFRSGNYDGSHDTVSYSNLEEVIDSIPDGADLNTYAAALLDVAMMLVRARKIFSRKDFDAPMAKKVVDSLSAYLAERATEANMTGDRGSNLSLITKDNLLLSSDSLKSRRRTSEYIQSRVQVPELVAELQHMHSDIDFADCLAMIEEGLHLPSPVSYVVPLSDDGKERSDSEEESERDKSGADDASRDEENPEGKDGEEKTPRPPASKPPSGSGPSPTPADPARFLAADGLALNRAALNTQKLNAGLDVAKEATKYVKNVLPKHLRVIRCAELIKKMRDNVRIGNWMEAFAAFSSIKEAELLTTVPLIQAEVVGAADTICNYYVIIVCRKALSSGFARGKIGLVDKKKISPTKLDDAVHTCAEIGCTNARALALREAVWLLAELRRAQIGGNWTTINEVMKKILDADIGNLNGYTDCCYEEVSWAKIERDNHEVTVQVTRAMMDEAITHKESLLDIAAVKVSALQEAYLRGTSIKEKYRGLVLVEVLSLADIVLKARKAVQQSNWFALNSLSALWKSELEEFQVQVESLEVGDHSMHRGGSIIRRSSMLVASGKSSGEGSRKAEKKFDLWPIFARGKEMMLMELLYIEQHFAMQELELEINTALRSGGMTSDMVGDVDPEKIDTEAISMAIGKRKDFEKRGMTLSDQLKNIFNAAGFIHKIRTMVQNNQWDSMRSAMEDAMTQTSSGLAITLPDISRRELQCVRHESENKWIISSMEQAVNSGQMKGTVDEIDIDGVSFSHLVPIISTCREMSPRTTKAINLVFTGEALVPLRRIITQRPVDWGALLSLAGSTLKPSSVIGLDTLVLPEIRLMEAVASEKLLCTNLSQCLGRFGPKGEPGDLDLTHTSTEEIEDAVMMAVNSGVKSIRGSQLLVACRDMVVLRKALLSTRSGDEETSKEAWVTLRRVVMTLFERHESEGRPRSSPASPVQPKDEALRRRQLTASTDKDADKEEYKAEEDAGWAICKNEVDFVSKDAHVEEVRMNLESNIKKTIAVYYMRSQVPCDAGEDHQSATKAARKATDGSLSIHVEVLTKILEYAEGLDFDNKILDRYRKVCQTLKQVRTCVIGDDFRDLKKILFTDKIDEDLKTVQVALEELQCAKMEYQNEAGILILETSIRYTRHGHTSDVLDGSHLTHGDYAKSANYNIHSGHLDLLKEYCRVHSVPESEVNVDPHSLPPVTQPYLFMYIAIRILQQSVPAYTMLRELLDCAVHVYQLRVGFASGESKEVSAALKWLRSESAHCPRQLQNEAKVAYIDHKNNLLRERITKALRTGRASHAHGEVDVSTVETEDLRRIIEQAKEFKGSLTLDMLALVEAAESLLVLRKAQKDGDIVALHDYLQQLAEYNRSQARKLHNMIIDEVASMLRALHNEMSEVALRCSLDAFVLQNHKPLPAFVEEPVSVSEAFLGIVGNNIYFEHVRSCATIKSNGGRNYPTLHAIGSADYVDKGGDASEGEDSDRHYCYDNIHRSDVSSSTIDTTLFDEALMISKDKGVYGARAKCLLRTVLMMRSVRIAMRQQDWHKVHSILTKNYISPLRSSAPFDPYQLPESLDSACALEVYVIQHQLEMRAAILEVFECLKTGWARCSNGIVDSACIVVEDLETAIVRCEASIEDAQSEIADSAESKFESGMLSGEADESKQEKIFSLLRSASIVSKARRLLLVGMLKEAGELASAAVNTGRGPKEAVVGTCSSQIGMVDETLVAMIGDKKVHDAALDELQLYAAEVHCALKLADLVSILREGITDGDSQELENLIHDSQSMMIQRSLRLNDLGLVRVLQRAQLVYRTLQKARKRLLKCTHSHDEAFITNALENARKLRLKDDELVAAAEERLRTLRELDEYFASLSASEGGVISSAIKFRLAARKAEELDLQLHPSALLAEVGKHLTYSSLRRLHLGQALSLRASSRVALDGGGSALGLDSNQFQFSGNEDAGRPFNKLSHEHGLPYAAATHTMRIKRAYLGHPSVRKRYKLELFEPLRDPKMFSLRMGVVNQGLQQSMLSFQETNLPTSITKLRPELAALSVWIFAHVIRGLENSTFTRIEVRLRDMVRLGREIPSMRDELLLQVIKQLSGNPHPKNTDRLWRCLTCCMAHFPPSSRFENHLELHLLETVEGIEREIDNERDQLARSGEAPVRDTSHLVKSSLGTDAMAPVKIHQKDSAPEELEKVVAINEKIERLRHRKHWARHCVRLLHEGCFLYGNDKAIAKPYDQSLERYLHWLSEPQPVVMMLRCQKQREKESAEKWNRILSSSQGYAQTKRADDDAGFSPSAKGYLDKTSVPKALMKVYEDPGWTDDITTQESVSSQGSTTTATTIDSGSNSSVDLQDLPENRESGMQKMQAMSQQHLTKSAFTVGASLFGKFETIKEEGDVRKATPGGPLLASKGNSSSSGSRSNNAAYSAFPAKLIADLVGGSGKINGSHHYWSHTFNRFANSHSVSPDVAAALKENVKRTRRSLRASRSLLEGASDTGDLLATVAEAEGASAPVPGSGPASGRGQEEIPTREASSESESDEDDGVRAAHRHLVIQKDAFLMKMCELSLGPQHSQVSVSPSLEDEVLRFLLGEGEPSRVGEATRWYNYHVGMGTGIDALPTASPFFSDAENEQSRVRVQWLLENISIPEKEKFSLPSDFSLSKSQSDSDSDSSERQGSSEEGSSATSATMNDDEESKEEKKIRLQVEEEGEELGEGEAAEFDDAAVDIARVTVHGTLFWETVIAPVCKKYGLKLFKDDHDGNNGSASNETKEPTISAGAQRGSVYASNYIKSLNAKTGITKIGLDMRLYRDLVQAGLVLFARRCRRKEKLRLSKQSVKERDVLVRFRTPKPPSSPPPAIKALGNIPDDGQGRQTQVFHMYTRSRAAADADSATAQAMEAERKVPTKGGKRASFFVKFAE